MVIELQPSVLQWARRRAGLTEEDLAKKFSTQEPESWVAKINDWERDGKLTYAQAEKLAKVTHTSFGYLFLDKPPQQEEPIPDFRINGGKEMGQMSPELLDVIYQSQRRQDWYRDYVQDQGGERLSLIGSYPLGSKVEDTARNIHKTLGFKPSECRESQLADVLKAFAQAIESAGILVVRSGKVGNNTRRLLDPNEFRGFALADDWAPLIFINTADTKAAQIFTMAHELAHLWAGQSAVSNLDKTYSPDQDVERYCNAVAAEYLVPLHELHKQVITSKKEGSELLRHLRLHFRVSDLVIIRRMYDAGYISEALFKKDYTERLERHLQQGGSGGNFHNNQPGQIGRRLGAAIIASTLEGKMLYRDALALMDMKKESSFKEFARTLNLHS
jgi:Zn-dependent peptidase ImmA (M78 family)/transcriptional regulator with XRE-family HTH domain